MNVVELQKKLLRAARSRQPADHVPYAFEQRILARIRQLPAADRWEARALILWRAALVCVLLTLGAGAWDFASERSNAALQDSLGADLENTVLAAVEHSGEPW